MTRRPMPSTLGTGDAGLLNLMNFSYVPLHVVTSPKQHGTVFTYKRGVLVFLRVLHEELLAGECHSTVQT